MVWALLGSHVGKPSSAYGWSGGFSMGSPVFTFDEWSARYKWNILGRAVKPKSKKKKKKKKKKIQYQHLYIFQLIVNIFNVCFHGEIKTANIWINKKKPSFQWTDLQHLKLFKGNAHSWRFMLQFLKGRQLLQGWSCLPPIWNLPKIGAALERKNLLPNEQILSFKSSPHLEGRQIFPYQSWRCISFP